MSDTNPAVSQEMQHLIFPGVLVANASASSLLTTGLKSNRTDTAVYRAADPASSGRVLNMLYCEFEVKLLGSVASTCEQMFYIFLCSQQMEGWTS